MFAGVDEAGRGPFIGPLVVAAVAVEDPKALTKIGVRDSKKVRPIPRSKFEAVIRGMARVAVITVSAEEINRRRAAENLNVVTRIAFQDALRQLRPAHAWVDPCGRDADAWARSVRDGLSFEIDVRSEKGADAIHAEVSAASIIAKAERERRMALIRAEYGDCGSGYPRDPKTVRFVQSWVDSNGSLPPVARTGWKTEKRIRF